MQIALISTIVVGTIVLGYSTDITDDSQRTAKSFYSRLKRDDEQGSRVTKNINATDFVGTWFVTRIYPAYFAKNVRCFSVRYFIPTNATDVNFKNILQELPSERISTLLGNLHEDKDGDWISASGDQEKKFQVIDFERNKYLLIWGGPKSTLWSTLLTAVSDPDNSTVNSAYESAKNVDSRLTDYATVAQSNCPAETSVVV